jgi:hypothetical protein
MNMSMKRMSWITFIFLPLVFVASIFGMNVDTFVDEQNIVAWWWYPIASLILLIGVMAFWLVYKIYPVEAFMNTYFIDPVRRVAERQRMKNAPKDEDDSDTTSTLVESVVDTDSSRDLEKGFKSGELSAKAKRSLRFWEYTKREKRFEKVE